MNVQVALIVLFLEEISGKIEIFPKILNFVQDGENKLCNRESNIYKNNLGNYTLWAHKMLDSSAKGAFGVLRGNDHQLGNFEECLNIHGPFPTQYCLVRLAINVPSLNRTDNWHKTVFTKLENPRIKNAKLGLCFPSSCSASDIQSSLTKTLNTLSKPFNTTGITYSITSTKELCSDYIHPKKFGILEITVCTLMVILVILVLIATILDYIQKEKSKISLSKKLCLSFSARTSWNQLFKMSGGQQETRIFDGVKSISIIIIFLSHLAAVIAMVPFLNGLMMDEILNSKVFYAMQQIDLVVDTFFVMSGLLLVHGIMQKWKEGNVNPILLVFYRYMRLTPVNLVVSLYYASMFNYFGSGPVWNAVYMVHIKSCLNNRNWWLNIFYLNNFVIDASDVCNFVNWYIACDFQLFIMGVLVLFVMKHNLRAGYALLAFLFILSLISALAITEIYKIIPIINRPGSGNYKNFINKYYIKPYNHASSYIVGMLGGIIYEKFKSQEIKILRKISYGATAVSVFLMVVSFGYFVFKFDGQETYMFWFALYNSLHRPLWCIGALGIFIVASFGSIPILRLFLSSSLWTPVAKLSYGIYLIHPMVEISMVANSVTVIQTRFFNMANLSIALLVMSFGIALFLYVVVEAPFVKMFRTTLLGRFYQKKRSGKQENTAVGQNDIIEIRND